MCRVSPKPAATASFCASKLATNASTKRRRGDFSKASDHGRFLKCLRESSDFRSLEDFRSLMPIRLSFAFAACKDSSMRRILLLMMISIAGCQQEMAEQPAYRPLERSAFFPDERSARPLPAGVVPRGTLQ